MAVDRLHLLDEVLEISHARLFSPCRDLDPAEETPTPEDRVIKIERVLQSSCPIRLDPDGHCLNGEIIRLADNWEGIAVEVGLLSGALVTKIGTGYTAAAGDRPGRIHLTAEIIIPVASALVPEAKFYAALERLLGELLDPTFSEALFHIGAEEAYIAAVTNHYLIEVPRGARGSINAIWK